MIRTSQTSMRDERIALAKECAKRLMEEHQAVEAVLLYGSVPRGNSLPVSDLDLRYVVPKRIGKLPREQLPKSDGITLDIDVVYLEDLVPERVLTDGFVFGMYSEAVVLADRTGVLTAFIQTIRKSDTEQSYRKRLEGMLEKVVKNLERYREGIRDMDYTEICRGSSFMMWCMAEYILCAHRQAPGGFSNLARLKVCNTDAFLRILQVQDSMHRGIEELQAFSFASLPMCQDKVAWMFDNGFKDEAFHVLWTNIGLKADKAKKDSTEEAMRDDVRRASEKWVKLLGWDDDTLHRKAEEMQELVDDYIRS